MPESADHSGDDPHQEEERRHLVEVPVVTHHADDEREERGRDETEHGHVPRVEAFATFGPRSTAPSPAPRVREACRIVPPIQTARASARKTMRNTAPERSGRPASFCAIPTWNGSIGLNAAPTPAAPRLIATAVTRRESHPSAEQEQHGHERDDLLLHVLERAGSGEEHADDRNHEQLVSVEAAHQRADRLAERARLVHHGERAAHEEDQEDHGGRIDESLRDRHQRLEGAHGRRRHRVERARDDDHATGHRIARAVVPARGKDVTQHGGEQHAAGEQRKGMREREASHAGTNISCAANEPTGEVARHSTRA